jgi:hypothetical protein
MSLVLEMCPLFEYRLSLVLAMCPLFEYCHLFERFISLVWRCVPSLGTVSHLSEHCMPLVLGLSLVLVMCPLLERCLSLVLEISITVIIKEYLCMLLGKPR